jgi:signal transduction histidine kinase
MRIQLLFNNLISNAVKYHDNSKNNKYIKIVVLSNKKEALITIEDNGIGIEKEHHEKLFDMFFRANKKIAGTGLGLFIAKGALEKIKGSISFKSEYKVGTTFEVKIPSLQF